MIQVTFECHSRLQNILQINDSYIQLLHLSCVDNLCMLEKDYLKWSNMVSLNIIKNDDLKDLCSCIYEYHQQYKLINTLNIINKEFSLNSFKNKCKFNLKSHTIQSIEIVLAKKLCFIKEFTLQFEQSFPASEVQGDDIQFHLMMNDILEIIIGQEDNDIGATISGNNGLNKQICKNQKQSIFLDCKLKEISKSGNYILLFEFNFYTSLKIKEMFNYALQQSNSIKQNEFIQPIQLLSQSKQQTDLLLIFNLIKRQEGKVYLQEHIEDSFLEIKDDKEISQVTLCIEMEFFPVEIKTLTNASFSPSFNLKSPQIKNTIRSPNILNLTFCRNNVKNDKQKYHWEQIENKEIRKKHLQSTKTQNNIQFILQNNQNKPKQIQQVVEVPSIQTSIFDKKSSKKTISNVDFSHEKIVTIQNIDRLSSRKCSIQSQVFEFSHLKLISAENEDIKIKRKSMFKQTNSMHFKDDALSDNQSTNNNIYSIRELNAQNYQSSTYLQSNNSNSGAQRLSFAQKQEVKKQLKAAACFNEVLEEKYIRSLVNNALENYRNSFVKKTKKIVKQIIENSQTFDEANINFYKQTDQEDLIEEYSFEINKPKSLKSAILEQFQKNQNKQCINSCRNSFRYIIDIEKEDQNKFQEQSNQVKINDFQHKVSEKIYNSQTQTHKRQWIQIKQVTYIYNKWRKLYQFKKKEYITFNSILVYTENTFFRQILKNIKEFKDVVFVNNCDEVLTEYQNQIENYLIFKFIIIDFTSKTQEQYNQLDKLAHVLKDIEKEYEIPQSFLIGIFEQNMNYEQCHFIDFWMDKNSKFEDFIQSLNK